ncbi:hypothetical protein FC26_GL000761 [Paucilactobacillus vaccinostercus DSM 20634]|jgi:hypothetical protein|uniref:Uncharacterized protein n=1 Tax=Paucilactobacillus vaccinostercus DSM 20634 TaxID=1423813 RepID=A0A0R2A4Q4_9LACO|nr:hypothetical protein [Paucilactobacillus vaccinostercus]KRM62200.1 hypothetical protein FC26_GL000761 [Paucilactobacillus vaccinostercus DSM 20634]
MLLDQDQKIKNIIAAQIVKVFYPFVIAKTETGELVNVNLSSQEKGDPLFWESIKRVLESSLWVPVGKKYHQLLDYGWVTYPEVR